MKFRNLIFIFLILFNINLKAQNFITEDEKPSKKEDNKDIKFSDRLIKGGDFYINFWGSVFEINVDPILGYKVNENLVVGTGIYFDYRQYSSTLKTTIFGGKLFGRYFFYKAFFVHSEFETLSLETKYFDVLNLYPNTNRFFYNGLYTGVGYNLSGIRNRGVTIMILYDLLYNENSIYDSPISFRFGINF